MVSSNRAHNIIEFKAFTCDLVGINYGSALFAETYNSQTGLLTVTDGTHTASITFDNFNATLDFASDGNGGTLITDPPANPTSGKETVQWGMNFNDDRSGLDQRQDSANTHTGDRNSVWVSGDNFVFHPNLGEEHIGVSSHGQIAEEVQNTAGTQMTQQLAALVTPEALHEMFVDLVHTDHAGAPSTIGIAQWHQMISGAIHLH
jgi:hypothetical protein